MLESVSGCAATILNSKELKAQFNAFYVCPGTFSLALLGICNGYHWLPAELRGRASRRPSCRTSSNTRPFVNVRVCNTRRCCFITSTINSYDSSRHPAIHYKQLIHAFRRMFLVISDSNCFSATSSECADQPLD